MKIISTILLLLVFQTFTVNGKDISSLYLGDYFPNYIDEFANYRLKDNYEFFLEENQHAKKNVILLQAYTNLTDDDPLKKLDKNLEAILVNLHPFSKKIFHIQYEFTSNKCENFNDILNEYYFEDINLDNIIISELPDFKNTYRVFYSHKFEDEFNYTGKGIYFEAVCVYGEAKLKRAMNKTMISFNNNLLSPKDIEDFKDYNESIKYPTSFGIKLLSNLENYNALDYSNTDVYLEEGVVSILMNETLEPSSFFEYYIAYFNPSTKQILQVEGTYQYPNAADSIQNCKKQIKKIQELFYNKYKDVLIHKSSGGMHNLYSNNKWSAKLFNNCDDSKYSILYSIEDKNLLKARELEIDKLKSNSF